MLTQERLKELLDYDPETGIFTWKIQRGRVSIGTKAGNLHSHGYLQIRIDGKKYYAHRLAWFYIYGVWPLNEIDHKDTIKHHNWIKNLRDVTRSENNQNQTKARKDNSTGFLGVVKRNGERKYSASIYIDGKGCELGRFDTPEDAHEAYLVAKRIHHSTCTI